MNNYNGIMMTTGFGFEGYQIKEYLGFVSGQTALSSSVFKDLAANMTEINAQESSKYAGKIETANDKVIDILKEVAIIKGANAVIGINFNYTELSSNSIGAIASGTAVRIEEKEPEVKVVKKELFVSNYYNRLVPRPVKVCLEGSNNNVKLSTWFYNYNLDEIIAVRADVELTNHYEEKLLIKGLDFVFDKKNISLLESEFIECKLPAKDVMLIKDVKVIINKYVTPRGVFACNDNPINVDMTPHRLESLKQKRGIDAVSKYITDGMIWTCNCGYVNEAGAEECVVCSRKQEEMKSSTGFNYEEMINEMNTKEYVIEIKDVLMDYIKNIDAQFRMELLEIMESGLQYEKTRGSMKDAVIEKVEKVFDGH